MAVAASPHRSRPLGRMYCRSALRVRRDRSVEVGFRLVILLKVASSLAGVGQKVSRNQNRGIDRGYPSLSHAWNIPRVFPSASSIWIVLGVGSLKKRYYRQRPGSIGMDETSLSRSRGTINIAPSTTSISKHSCRKQQSKGQGRVNSPMWHRHPCFHAPFQLLTARVILIAYSRLFGP